MLSLFSNYHTAIKHGVSKMSHLEFDDSPMKKHLRVFFGDVPLPAMFFLGQIHRQVQWEYIA
jgi:hypothetical protein